MKAFACGRCGQRVYFETVSCGACGAALAFVPDELAFAAFEVGEDGTWQRLGPQGPAQRPCVNYANEGVCNWAVPADSADSLCVSCRTTHVIPALGKPENRTYWSLLEQAKRRLFFSLLSLNLPAPSKSDDPRHGLSFQFLEEVTPKEHVLTGHDEGVITLNIAEADDARREQMRAHLHEPYRTLLGHFRHESGHYYWDRLVSESPWIDDYRRLFGDERADYVQALQKHYAQPAADWAGRFVSLYASSHPWEDWAECWAHYLHIVDGLQTAAAWGLQLDNALPGSPAVRPRAIDEEDASLQDALVEQWLPVSRFINAMDRSLGSHDSYPFVVPPPVIEKLDFIHKVVGAAGRREVPMLFGGETPAQQPASEQAGQPAPVAPPAAVPAPVQARAPALPPTTAV
jgi:hypothetical protein